MANGDADTYAMQVFGANGVSNDGFDDDVGSGALNNPKSGANRRLPPLNSLDAPSAPTANGNKGGKSPRHDRKTVTDATQEAAPAENGSDVVPKQKKRKNKRRDKDYTRSVSDESQQHNGHLEEHESSSKLTNGHSNRPPSTSSDKGVLSDHAPVKPARDMPKAVNITDENDEPVVRSKDPQRHVEVVADIEGPYAKSNNKESLSLPATVPRSTSSASLRHYETDGGTIEEMDVIEMAPPTPTAPKSPRPILKQTSQEEHVTNMFMAGSRPPSASSTKQTVRISDEVSYSDTNLKKSASNGRPKSASNGRPKSAGKSRPGSGRQQHRNSPSHTPGIIQNATDGKYDHWRLKKTTQRKISPHFKTSIFTMLFCGLFPGAAALYFSFQARKALKAGDEKQAVKYARYSKSFNIAAIATGLGILVIVVIIYSTTEASKGKNT